MKRHRPARSMATVASVVALGFGGLSPVAAGSAAATAAAPQVTSTAQAAATPSDERVGRLAPFQAENIPLRRVDKAALPYQVGGYPLTITDRPVDKNGIVKYRQRSTGKLYDHPVNQSSHVMGWLTSYHRTKDKRYLQKSIQLADHLLKNSVVSRGARFYPYPFDFALHGNERETLKAPWYSGMAQGQVLAAFLRLHDATGDERWMRAAHETFASFTVPRVAGQPWVSDVDANGRLWLEEYPHATHADRAYNGHNFAVLGLYEYWWATQSADAAKLLRGSMTATLAYAPSIRRAGQLSRYCLTHDVRSTSYHAIHIRQLHSMSGLTGDPRFARWGDTFLADHPAAYSGGVGRLAWGDHRMIATNAAGAVSSRRTVTYPRAHTVTFDRRARVGAEPGIWLRIGSGAQKGLWVREQPGRAFVSGQIEPIRLSPARTVTFAAGTHVGYSVDRNGVRRAAKRLNLSRASTAPTTERAVIDGFPAVKISAGPLKDLFVILDGRARLR